MEPFSSLLSLPSPQLATDIVAIEPHGLKHCLVATEALTQRGEMIFARPPARSQRCGPRTRHPYPLIGEQRLIEIVGGGNGSLSLLPLRQFGVRLEARHVKNMDKEAHHGADCEGNGR